jgi:hypothetical protein
VAPCMPLRHATNAKDGTGNGGVTALEASVHDQGRTLAVPTKGTFQPYGAIDGAVSPACRSLGIALNLAWLSGGNGGFGGLPDYLRTCRLRCSGLPGSVCHWARLSWPPDLSLLL